MQGAFGGVITNLKTSTDVATGEVSVGKALPDEPGAVPVRLLGALNSAEFSFFRPLRKLNIKVPADRQFNVTPFTREIDGVGTVFVFPMAEPLHPRDSTTYCILLRTASGKNPPNPSVSIWDRTRHRAPEPTTPKSVAVET